MVLPKVSIVMPVYNGELYIREAIDSIINQIFKDWELIIVNDGSTDSTVSIVEEYCRRDKRINLIHNAVNSGISKTINNGFSKAKGSYHTWTSDDNLYKPNALLKMYSFLEDDSERKFVYSGMEIIDERGNHTGYESLEPETLYYNCCVGGCFLYSKEVTENVGGYSEDWPLVHDYEYWLRVNEKYRLYHLDEDLYCYRMHSNNLTSRKFGQLNYELFKLREQWYDVVVEGAKGEEKEFLYVDMLMQNPQNKKKLLLDFFGGNLPKKLEWTTELKEIDKKKKILFGCGEFGGRALELLGEEKVAFFADNDSSKIGSMVLGKEVISFDKMKSISDDYQIVISVGTRIVPAIVRQFKDNGISNYITYIQFARKVDL